MGVLIGILATLRTEINFSDFLKRGNGEVRRRLEYYFLFTIIGSLVVLALSLLMYFPSVIQGMSKNLWHILAWCLAYAITYTGGGLFRLILFFVKVLFSNSSKDIKPKEYMAGITDEDRKKLYNKTETH